MVYLPLSKAISALYCAFSFSDSLSLSAKNSYRWASLPIISIIRYLAFSNFSPTTLFSEKNMTGYFPICSSHSSLFLDIYRPSNRDLSVPSSKNERSILMLRVFPNLRGRVNNVTLLQLSNNCSIRFVLSI